jgi:hypothetical protein
MSFNQFKIYANQTLLDTYEDFSVSFNYQIADIIDISTRTTSFSKTIVIPGTAANNQFFQNIFDLNVDISNTSYNPKMSLPCTITIGDVEIFSGNLELLTINTNQKLVEYEIVVTGILRNLFFNMADFYVTDLNFSEYNHTRSISAITNSWNYQIKKNGQDYDATGLGEGYVYPYINYGNSQDINTTSYVYDLAPAIYVKTIVDKLFQNAGYTYSSNFFNSQYFKELIIPFTSDRLQYSPEQLSALTTNVSVLNTYTEYTPGLSNQYSSYEFPAGITGWRQLSQILTRNSTYNNNTKAYYFPLEKETGTIGNITMQDPMSAFTSNPITPITKYVVQESGFYKIDFNMTFIMKYINTNGSNIRFTSGDFTYGAALIKRGLNGTLSNIQSAPYPNYFNSTFQPSSGTHASPWYDTNTELSISMNVPSIYLEAGEQILLNFQVKYNDNVRWFNPLDNQYKRVLALALVKNNTQGSPNYLTVAPASNVIANPIIPVDMNQLLPQVKQRDFFLSLVKMFNLMIQDDPNQAGNLIVEPRDDFFASRMKVKDWTDLVDYNQDIVVTPMSELDVRRYEFKYQLDDDYYNTQYDTETNGTYGNYGIDYLNEFSNEVRTIELLFASTPNTNNYIGNRVAPFFATLDANTMRPHKVKPRILFYSGLKNTTSPYTLKNNPTSSTGLTLNTYAYCGMWDDPVNPNYDLAWDEVEKTYFPTSVYPQYNLIQQFWTSTLRELQDINAKMVEMYIYLTPKDISDFDFRDIIFIDNAYYRVNRIVDYDPISIDKTTKVELYKLQELNFNPPTVIETPASNVDCPDDIVGKVLPNGYTIYVSKSGQRMTGDCCKSIGGIWSNGFCQAISTNPNGDGVNPAKPVNSKYGSGLGNSNTALRVSPSGDNKGTVPQERPMERLANNTINNSPNTLTQGFGIYVSETSKNSIVLGDGGVVSPGVENAVVIGTDVNATVSNSVTVNSVIIKGDDLSLAWANPYIIDGGLNDVMNDAKTNFIDIIDGGFNSVRNFGGDSKLRPIIDGSEPPATN